MADSKTTTQEGLHIERTFDAPRELVWRAWSDPQHFAKWWGPRAFTAPVVKIDFRVGGKWLAVMRDADGKDIWATGTYQEIVPMERIVTTDSFADADGNIVPSTHYGMEGMPLEMTIIVNLEDAGNGKTRLTLDHIGLPAGEHIAGANEGWNESFDKLAEVLQA